jgi:hypothetical protein
MNPTTVLIVSMIGLLLPVASARIVRAHWDSSVTGLITGGLAAAAGIATEWIREGDSFDWKTAAAATFAAWLTGRQLTQAGVLSNTQLEAKLLNAGSGLNTGPDANFDPTVGLDYDDAEHPSPSPHV